MILSLHLEPARTLGRGTHSGQPVPERFPAAGSGRADRWSHEHAAAVLLSLAVLLWALLVGLLGLLLR